MSKKLVRSAHRSRTELFRSSSSMATLTGIVLNSSYLLGQYSNNHRRVLLSSPCLISKRYPMALGDSRDWRAGPKVHRNRTSTMAYSGLGVNRIWTSISHPGVADDGAPMWITSPSSRCSRSFFGTTHTSPLGRLSNQPPFVDKTCAKSSSRRVRCRSKRASSVSPTPRRSKKRAALAWR